MKRITLFFIAAVAAGLAGCRGLGFNDQSLNNDLTPGTSERTYVRSYPEDNANQPVVVQVPSANAGDPAYPHQPEGNDSPSTGHPGENH
jgi:hypothetical protein